MKQRINREQLEELTDEQKTKLAQFSEYSSDWSYVVYNKQGEYLMDILDSTGFRCKMAFDHYGLCKKNGGSLEEGEEIKLYPLLNIGQMIEVLNKHDMEIELGGAEWFVCWNGHINKRAPELCDALWKTVKEAL